MGRVNLIADQTKKRGTTFGLIEEASEYLVVTLAATIIHCLMHGHPVPQQSLRRSFELWP